MDDSDSDFSDAGEDNFNDVTEKPSKVNKQGVKVRGPDKSWVQVHRFASAEVFNQSDIAKKLKKEFSCRKKREFDYADVHDYECKFKRKVVIVPCPMKYKVAFLSHCPEVTVDVLEDALEHRHDEDQDFVENPSKNYRWTDEATKIVSELVKNHVFPAQIEKTLKSSDVFRGNMPTKAQLYNKCAAEKKKFFKTSKVNNTHELRMKISEFLDEPSSEFESYVAHHEINDDDPNKEPRFTIIMTSKKNLKKMKDSRLLQTDATYRLNWFGFPVFVVGMFCFLNIYHIFYI